MQRKMGKVVEHNEKIFPWKRECWDIEDKIISIKAYQVEENGPLMTMEEAIVAIEKECPKKYKFAKPENVQPLDFKERKFAELEERIHLLEKNQKSLTKFDSVLLKIRNDFNVLKRRYFELVSLLEAEVKELDKYNKTLCLASADLYKEITEDSKQPAERLKCFSSLDGSVLIKILIEKFELIRVLNDQECFRLFQKAYGADLRNVCTHRKNPKKDVTMEEVCLTLIPDRHNPKDQPRSIKDFLEEFTKQKLDQVNSDNVTQKIMGSKGGPLLAFCTAIHDKFHLIESEAASADNASFYDHLRMEIYLSAVLETYKFTNELQMKGLAGAVWGVTKAALGGDGGVVAKFRAMTVDEVENPYRLIPLLATRVRPFNSEVKKLLIEVSELLEGLYYRCYSQIPDRYKNNDAGETLKKEVEAYNGDNDDRLFANNKADETRALVKIVLAKYHRSHHLNIDAVIRKVDPNYKIGATAFVPAAIAKTPPVNATTNASTPITSVTNITPPAAGNVTYYSAKPSAATSTLFSATGGGAKPLLYASKCRQLLDIQDGGGKLNMLLTFLNENELNQRQLTSIAQAKQGLINVLNTYRKAWTSNRYVPHPIGRTHSTDARTTEKKMQNCVDSVDALKEFIQLGLKINGSSDELLPEMIKNIKSLIDLLISFATPDPTPLPAVVKPAPAPITKGIGKK